MQINDTVEESRTTWVLEGDDSFEKKDVELLYIALAMGGEVGELENLVKKFFRKRYYNKGHTIEDKLLLESMEGELADILYYTSRAADLLKIDLEKAFIKKMDENRKRYLANK